MDETNVWVPESEKNRGGGDFNGDGDGICVEIILEQKLGKILADESFSNANRCSPSRRRIRMQDQPIAQLCLRV